MGCGWSRLGNTAPDPCLLKAGAPPVDADGASAVFPIRDRSAIPDRSKFRIARIDPPRLNSGRLNSRQWLERHALQGLDARALEHPLYPCVDVGTVGARLDTQIAQHQYTRHEANVGD